MHSLKDLPTAAARAASLLAAVPLREDPRDVLVARDGLDPRRAAAPAPGSAPARRAGPRSCAPSASASRSWPSAATSTPGSGWSRDGELDAVVLARAGLARLGRLDEVTEVHRPDRRCCPPPARARWRSSAASDDAADRSADLLGVLDDAATRLAVTAERTLLAALEAGCSAPVGALRRSRRRTGEHTPSCTCAPSSVPLDGSAQVRLSATGPLDEAARIGRDLAADLLAEGAADLMGERVT